MKPNKNNQIDNKELKENLADAALSLLKQNKDYKNLENTSVEFGYLFDIDNHGLEALFKVITDNNTIYFAAQGNSLKMLDLDEDIFKAVTEQFLSIHS